MAGDADLARVVDVLRAREPAAGAARDEALRVVAFFADFLADFFAVFDAAAFARFDFA